MKGPFIITVFILTCLSGLHAQDNVKLADTLRAEVPDSVSLVNMLEQAKLLIKTDSAQATKLLISVRKDASKAKQVFILALAHKYLGDIYFYQQNYNRAFGSYVNAKNIYLDNTGDYDLTELTIALARTQYHRGNYRLAVNNFVEALQLARQQNQKEFEAEALENLGLLYNSFQGFNEGTAYYLNALKIKQSLNDEKGAVRFAQILGETYYRKRIFDSAFIFSELAYKGAKKLGLYTEEYMSDINKAMSLIRLKDWKPAEVILKKIGAGVNSNQDVNRLLRYEIAYGNFYLSQGDTSKGNIYYEKAKRIARENFPDMYVLVYRSIAESYYELSDYRQAYENFIKYNNYVSQIYSGKNLANLGSLENIMNATTSKDEVKMLSLQNELKQNQLIKELLIRQGLERENELMDFVLAKEKSLAEALQRENIVRRTELEKETSLKAALKRENELNSQQLKKERNTKIAVMAGALLLLFSASSILYFYRKQKKKNAIIQRQADDMQVLMKEIHHRVKNNLQVISSLLDLQSMTIADNQASEAVKEGKNRVQSMALIHQNLYSEGNIKGIRTKEYISNLVQSLCDSYNVTNDKVKIKTQIDDLNLDVDTMIPMGLVLNELVSNSLKYAFNRVQHGELTIVLKKELKHLLLKVSDNGNGYPEGINIKEGKTFGMRMIRAFAQKLKAKLDIYNNNGAVVEMQITKYQIA